MIRQSTAQEADSSLRANTQVLSGMNGGFTQQSTNSGSFRAASMNLESLAAEESKLQSGIHHEELETKLQLYTD